MENVTEVESVLFFFCFSRNQVEKSTGMIIPFKATVIDTAIKTHCLFIKL